MTYKAQVDIGATNGGIGLTIYQRAQNALVAYSMYLQSALIPVNLSPFYPHPGIWSNKVLLISCFISLSVGVVALLSIRKNPSIFVGVAMFFGTLVPTIGLVQVGIQAYADRYTYLPNIGLFIAAVYGGDALRRRFNVRPLFVFLPVFVLLISYASLTRLYVNQWQSNASLWSHSLMVLDPKYLDLINDLDPTYSTPQVRALSFPYIMMGIALFTDGNVAFSVTHLEQARRLGMINHWQPGIGWPSSILGREAHALRSFDIFERGKEPIKFSRCDSELRGLSLSQNRRSRTQGRHCGRVISVPMLRLRSPQLSLPIGSLQLFSDLTQRCEFIVINFFSCAVSLK